MGVLAARLHCARLMVLVVLLLIWLAELSILSRTDLDIFHPTFADFPLLLLATGWLACCKLVGLQTEI